MPRIATFIAYPRYTKAHSLLRGDQYSQECRVLTQNCGVYIDEVLAPFITTLPSYTKGTTDLLMRLDGLSIDPDNWRASIDVESLYTFIPHTQAMHAVEYFLSTHIRQYWAHNQLVLDLLNLTLTRSYFLFNGKMYYQLRGTTMGSPCAPTYTNLFLCRWEATFVFGEEDIDDILVIWTGTKEEWRGLVDLNQNEVGLRFTYDIHPSSLPFLDVWISNPHPVI